MGYSVIYGPVRDKHTRPRRKWPFIGMVCIFFALFCTLAHHFFREELILLYQILLPNSSIEALIRQLKDGENVIQAVTAFCEDVLNGY